MMFTRQNLIPVLAAVLGAILFATVPASAQYDIYDLGVPVVTQDIQADNTNTVHVVWTNAGMIYYGRIVNNAITGRVEVSKGIQTIYWRPYVSVRSDGGSVNIAWTTAGMGNSLKHSWRDASGWHTETIMTVPDSQWLCQATCAADSSGLVHLMYVIWNKAAGWSTIFYRRKPTNGQWETQKQFAPLTAEYKHPMLFVDSQGRVHATWNLIGNSGGDSFEAYYGSAASGGSLVGATIFKIPKSPYCNVNGYGDVYADHNGVAHRSIGGYSNAQQKMCIVHSQKAPGGGFTVPTMASIDYISLGGHCDPVPAVVAGEDGRVIVAWGLVGADGSNTVKASFYDPNSKSWSLYTVDPAAGITSNPNAYRVAVTRTDTHVYGVWRGSNGNLKLFAVPVSGSPLRVTSPNGGESWETGSTHDITWDQTDLSGNVTIELFKSGAKVADIGSAAAAAETYSWTVPTSTAAGSDYRIRLTQGAATDESNSDFAIRDATIPRISLSRNSLVFGATTGGIKTQDQGIVISNSGNGTLGWTATPSQSWITVSPGSGSGNSLLSVGVNPSGLSAGTHTGTVAIADSKANNSPQTIAVTLSVHETAGGPFGEFEQPVNDSVLKGTAAVSGWALDDIEVTRLEIRRDPVAGDSPDTIGGDGLVYIGDAAFIEGARPGLETAYSGTPFNQRGVWAYMMMTYGLPKYGNGKFVLHAVAFDREGNRVEIGNKTVIGKNALNKKPFGLIDAPAQGGTASGSQYTNTGWMLTPLPKIIRPDGSTIWVWVDGVRLGHPVYNQYRADVARNLPRFRNSRRAGGVFRLNTTLFADGLHTITWVAKDSGRQLGNTGSNYFTILNAVRAGAQSPWNSLASSAVTRSEGKPRQVAEVVGLPLNMRMPVFSRTGFLPEKTFEPLFPGGRGLIDVRMESLDRIEIRLDAAEIPSQDSEQSSASSARTGEFEGYLIVGEELRPLPIGSTLNPDTGVFCWQPGPGFLGPYDFVFIKHNAGQFSEKRLVTIRISAGSDETPAE